MGLTCVQCKLTAAREKVLQREETWPGADLAAGQLLYFPHSVQFNLLMFCSK